VILFDDFGDLETAHVEKYGKWKYYRDGVLDREEEYKPY